MRGSYYSGGRTNREGALVAEVVWYTYLIIVHEQNSYSGKELNGYLLMINIQQEQINLDLLREEAAA